MPKFKLFPKRPHFSHPKITLQPSTLPSSEQHPSLPNYSNTNSHPNDNLATQHDTLIITSVTSKTETPIKVFSRVNYPFLLHLLELPFSLLANSLLEHFSTPSQISSPENFLKLATPFSFDTLVAVPIPQINSTLIIITVLKTLPSKVDKSTR